MQLRLPVYRRKKLGKGEIVVELRRAQSCQKATSRGLRCLGAQNRFVLIGEQRRNPLGRTEPKEHLKVVSRDTFFPANSLSLIARRGLWITTIGRVGRSSFLISPCFVIGIL